jgi:hypothetical protein
MRAITLAFLGIFLLGIWGCSLPRMAVMHARGLNDVPLVEGGRRVKVEAEGKVGHAKVEVHVRSKLSARETFRWYRQELKRRGWTVHGTEDFEREEFKWLTLQANREVGKVGNLAMIEEHFSLEVRDFEGGSNVYATLSGVYFWDWPSYVAVGIVNATITYPYLMVQSVGNATMRDILEAPMWGISIAASMLF